MGSKHRERRRNGSVDYSFSLSLIYFFLSCFMVSQPKIVRKYRARGSHGQIGAEAPLKTWARAARDGTRTQRCGRGRGEDEAKTKISPGRKSERSSAVASIGKGATRYGPKGRQ